MTIVSGVSLSGDALFLFMLRFIKIDNYSFFPVYFTFKP